MTDTPTPEDWGHTVTTGCSGSGKSYLSQARAAARARVLALEWDPTKSEYGGKKVFGLPGLKAELAAFEKNTKPFRISFYPELWRKHGQGPDGKPMTDFRIICQLAWAVQNVTLLVEEAGMYFPDGEVPFEFGALLSRGRHRNVSVWMVSQNPFQLPPSTRNEIKTLTAFKLLRKESLAWVAGFPEAPEDMAARVKALPDHRYIEVTR